MSTKAPVSETDRIVAAVELEALAEKYEQKGDMTAERLKRVAEDLEDF